MTGREPSTDDRVLLRALVEAYAGLADGRRFGEFGALFGPTGRLYVYREAGQSEPSGVRTGADEIAAVVERGLTVYEATSHMVGAHTVEMGADADTATGSTTCRAYHLSVTSGGRQLMVMTIRYDDRYVRSDGRWRFDERHVRLMWREQRVLDPVDSGDGARTLQPESELGNVRS